MEKFYSTNNPDNIQVKLPVSHNCRIDSDGFDLRIILD